MRTLLIADDEQLERDAIELLVKKNALPLQTLKARNGREAVEMAQSVSVDIALLDIRMPGLSGMDAARRIHEISPKCRIVFLTAWNSFDFAQEAVRIGAKDYLVKPTTSQDVVTLLSKLLDDIESEQKEQKRQNREEIRDILKQFNRSFFAAIKYGMVSLEGMRSYFVLEGIHEEQGFAVIVDTMEETKLLEVLEDGIRNQQFNACYFPAVDRISILIFSSFPETIVKDFHPGFMLLSCPGCHAGIGRPFKDLTGIPSSLRQASQAYMGAVHFGKSLFRFDELSTYKADFIDNKVKKTEVELVSVVLDGQLENARRLAHELQDLAAFRTNSNERELLDGMYELVLVVTRNIGSRIPNFSYEQVQKTSLMELERYFMDFIDAACKTVETDRKDKYTRMFQSIREYIEIHYAEQLSLEQMAEFAGISPSYFSRLFRDYTGDSFVDYLTDARMRAAKRMIRTGMKIQTVAELTGFTDYSYFSRVFRHTEGLSPRDFQKNTGIHRFSDQNLDNLIKELNDCKIVHLFVLSNPSYTYTIPLMFQEETYEKSIARHAHDQHIDGSAVR